VRVRVLGSAAGSSSFAILKSAAAAVPVPLSSAPGALLVGAFEMLS